MTERLTADELVMLSLGGNQVIDLLGCWYTNNGAHPEILRASLIAMERAQSHAGDDRVTITTCVWEPIPENPFPEIVAHHKMSNHLGIALQIMNCLWHADDADVRPAVVCFLEHDVIYPQDYFTRVISTLENSPEADGAFNPEYIGMNETGYLQITQKQHPMHQISLRSEVARKQLQTVIKRCVMDGAAILEPANATALAPLPSTGRPAVHINHSKNFTSHFNTYEKIASEQTHPYWGYFRDYYPQSEHQMR